MSVRCVGEQSVIEGGMAWSLLRCRGGNGKVCKYIITMAVTLTQKVNLVLLLLLVVHSPE